MGKKPQVITLICLSASFILIFTLQLSGRAGWFPYAALFLAVISGLVFWKWSANTDNRQQELESLLNEAEKNRSKLEKSLKEQEQVFEKIVNGAAYTGQGNTYLPENSGMERLLSIICEFLSRHGKSGHMEKCFTVISGLNPEIFAVIDLKGIIVTASPVFMAVYGYYNTSEYMGCSILDFITPENRKQAEESIINILSKGINRNNEYTIRTKDGRKVDLLLSSTISLKAAGNPVSILAVTDGQPGEQAALLRKSFFILSPDTKVFYMSPAMYELLGYTEENAEGRQISYFLDGNENAVFDNYLNTCRDQAKETIFDTTLVKRDGFSVAVSAFVLPIFSKEDIYLGAFCSFEDKTECRIMETALEHRLSIEKLIASISARFINVAPDKIGNEIESSLKSIGDFFGVVKSAAVIFANAKTGEEKSYRVINKNEYVQLFNNEAFGSSPSNESESLDTVSIPFNIDSEMVGFFRFDHVKFQRAWLEEDIMLLKLVGEIIVNALTRTQNEKLLMISEARLKITLHSIGDAVISTDTGGNILMLNSSAEGITGWKKADAIGKPLFEVLNIIKGSITDIKETQPEEVTIQSIIKEYENKTVLLTKERIEKIIDATKTPILDELGNHHGEILVFRDITEKRLKEEEIIYLSFHDKLTGLFNRAFFEEEMYRLDTKRQYPITLVIGDLNNLKIANDTYGHSEGDRLLRKISEILRKETRKEDIIARWGGDEFALLLPKTTEETGKEICKRILDACAAEEANPIQPSIALGSATKTDDSRSLENVLKEAEKRMYSNKELDKKRAGR